MKARELSSGYWHLRGTGPCNWAQPPTWPCDEITLRAYAFAQANEAFIQECLRDLAAQKETGR